MLKKGAIQAAVVSAAMILGSPVLAQEVTDADRVQIEARIDILEQALAGGDFAASLDVTPPALRAALARRFGITEGEMRALMAEAMGPMMAEVTLVSYEMNVPGGTIHTTPVGGRTYLLIPTTTVMDVKDAGRVRGRTETLASMRLAIGIWSVCRRRPRSRSCARSIRSSPTSNFPKA